MKKTILLFSLFCSLLGIVETQAQRDSKKFSFGFGLEGGTVTGKFKSNDVYSGAGGITLRASYKVGPGFATLTSGALLYIPGNITTENTDDLKVGVQIPLKAGYKFIFLKHLFVQGEAGYSAFKVGYTNGESEEVKTESYGGFTYAPTVGANFGAFEIGVRYETVVKVGNPGTDLSTAMVRLGFNF